MLVGAMNRDSHVAPFFFPGFPTVDNTPFHRGLKKRKEPPPSIIFITITYAVTLHCSSLFPLAFACPSRSPFISLTVVDGDIIGVSCTVACYLRHHDRYAAFLSRDKKEDLPPSFYMPFLSHVVQKSRPSLL
ncbi:unnamed protein product [Pylaiella littoralis]